MHIAICDNEAKTAEALKHQIICLNPLFSVCTFTSIYSFFDAISNECDHKRCFDVVCMDIDWNENDNGIDFAERLLKTCPATQIIYVTGYGEKYSQRIFLSDSNLCGYLVKPVDKMLLSKLLDKAGRKINLHTQNGLFVNNKGVAELIPYDDISYLENVTRKTVAHTQKMDLEINRPLEQVRKELPDNFLNCHKSYSVNMNYIRRIDNTGITLLTGVIISISRSRYAESRNEYL